MLNGLEEILAKHELSDEVKTALLGDINGAAKGLVNKKTELELKIANKEGLTAAEKAKLVELEQFKSNAEIANAKAAEDWQTASDLQAAQWKIESEAKDSRIAAYEKSESDRLITDGARKQLTDLGVNPLHMEAQMALITLQSKIVDSKAMIGDQTQSEFIEKWALTDSGKAAITAQNNSGGNGNGGTNTPTGKPLTLTEKAILANQNK
jgi:hypothetical protein